jgi:hypothetical protein
MLWLLLAFVLILWLLGWSFHVAGNLIRLGAAEAAPLQNESEVEFP